MNHTIGYCIIICAVALVGVLSAVSPHVLGDENGFLKNFVNHEFLNVLGVIMAITLASASQLHLTLNQVEERHKTKNAFLSTRANIRQGAYFLIIAFLAGTLIVTTKPLAGSTGWALSLFNGASLIILLWDTMVLLALTQAVFSLKPEVD